MSLTKLDVDRTVLPAALLPLAKAHLRVEFSRDDAYITQTIARAIDQFERKTGFSVFAADYEWSPGPFERRFYAPAYLSGAWLVPVQPIVEPWAAEIPNGGGAAVDVTANYQLIGDIDSDRVGAQYFVGPPAAGLAITFTAGFAAIEDLSPGLVDVILRRTAYLYEFREAVAAPGASGAMTADWWNDELVGHWAPRC